MRPTFRRVALCAALMASIPLLVPRGLALYVCIHRATLHVGSGTLAPCSESSPCTEGCRSSDAGDACCCAVDTMVGGESPSVRPHPTPCCVEVMSFAKDVPRSAPATTQDVHDEAAEPIRFVTPPGCIVPGVTKIPRPIPPPDDPRPRAFAAPLLI